MMGLSGLQVLSQGNVVLAAGGIGTLRFAPAGTSWQVERIAVKVTTRVLEAICRIYVGPGVSDNYYVVGTLSGSTGDTTTGDHVYLPDGSPMWVQWSGGDVGATATAIVWGYQEIGSGGFNAFR